MVRTIEREGFFVLGGSSDIGISLARLLLERGKRPYLSHATSRGKEKIMDELGEDVRCVHLDLSSRDSISSFFSSLDLPVSYLVDLAHERMESLFASAADKLIYSYYLSNVAGRAIFLKYMVRHMLKGRWGRMIFVSSCAARFINPGQSYYASSKAASEALYHAIGVEMAPRGISTLVLRLGYVRAGRGDSFLKEHPFLEEVALTCEEVAEAILFFCTERGRCFSSTEVVMDRGFCSMLKKLSLGGR